MPTSGICGSSFLECPFRAHQVCQSLSRALPFATMECRFAAVVGHIRFTRSSADLRCTLWLVRVGNAERVFATTPLSEMAARRPNE